MKLSISLHDIMVFWAVFLRIGILLFILPFFRGLEIPTSFKALASLFISFFFYILLAPKIPPLPTEPVYLFMVVLGELVFGICLSLALILILGAIETAGEIISFQMGFGFVQVADPITGVQITIISRFFQLLATLIFFAINGHHYLILAIYKSFEVFPVGALTLRLSEDISLTIIKFSTVIFTLAFKMAAPIIIALFLTEVGMGFIVKFAPQINILIVGFALTIIIGILFAYFSMEAWGKAVERAFREAFSIMEGLLAR